MKIEDLLPDTCRKTAEQAADFVLEHPAFVHELINHSFSDKHIMAMRASRVLNLLQEKEPAFIAPLLPEILPNLPNLKDHSAKRNLMKLFIGHTRQFQEEEQLQLIELCFGLVKKLDTETGTRSYCLEILFELSKKIPEIQSELLAVIDLQYDTASTSVKCKAAKIRKEFRSKSYTSS